MDYFNQREMDLSFEGAQHMAALKEVGINYQIKGNSIVFPLKIANKDIVFIIGVENYSYYLSAVYLDMHVLLIVK